MKFTNESGKKCEQTRKLSQRMYFKEYWWRSQEPVVLDNSEAIFEYQVSNQN